MKRALLLLSLLLAFSAPAYASFAYKIAMVVDPTQVISNASNFAVEFKGTDNSLKQSPTGQMQNASAYDARAFSDSTCTTALDFELDSYDASAPQLIMWVRIPMLSGSVPTNYWICFGDASLTTNASSTSTWASQYKLISHYADGTTLSVVDSTSNANNGTNHSATATTGQIDGAAALASASSQYIDYGTTASLSPSAMSFFTWIKATSFPNAYNSVVGKEGAVPTQGYTLLVKSNGKLAIYIRDSIGNDIHYDGTGSHTLSTGTWYWVGFTYAANGSLIGYVGGASDATASGTANGLGSSSAYTFYIGNSFYASRFWNGAIDNPELTNTASVQDWITAEYNNQSNPTAGGFYSSITYSANSSGGRASTVPLTGAGH